MTSITIDELHKKYKDLKPHELILDVREPEEYKEGHVPGSRNIPYEIVQNHFQELKKYERIYVYCARGGRADLACSSLFQAGLKNIVPVAGGGMPDWICNGYPIEK